MSYNVRVKEGWFKRSDKEGNEVMKNLRRGGCVLISLVWMSFLLFVVIPGVTADDNLLENPGFEDSTELDGWKPGYGQGEILIVSAPEVMAHSGKNCLMVKPGPERTGGDIRKMVSNNAKIPLKGGDIAQFTFWVKGKGPSIALVLYRYDAGGNKIGGKWMPYSWLKDVKPEWTKLSGAVPVEDITDEKAVSELVEQGWSPKVASVEWCFDVIDVIGDGYVYLDDASITIKNVGEESSDNK